MHELGELLVGRWSGHARLPEGSRTGHPVRCGVAGFGCTPAGLPCDILGSIGFPDRCDYVTQWIVGDIATAQYQAAYWDAAARVAAGETTWSAVFDGTSPYQGLLRGHLTQMGERYAEPARQALEEDPGFDPAETSPGV